VSVLVRVVSVAALCGLTLPSPTGTQLLGGVAAIALAALLIAMSSRAAVAPAVSVAPTRCAAKVTRATPVTRLRQLDPDAAGQPRPRAPGRRTAVAAA
jgi:hypothetical protein